LNAFTHDPQPSHGAWSAVDPDHRGVGFQVDDDLDKRLIMMRAVLVILFLLFSLAGDTAGVQPDGIGGGVGTDGISNAPSQIDLSQYTLTFAEDFDTLSILRNPRQCGHRFRRKAATQSDRKRPPIPNEGGHPVDRVKRGTLSAV
jgi:hypothetical protein